MKPQQILDLEKELGFELTETEDSGGISTFMPPESYALNEKQEIIGLSLWDCPVAIHFFLNSLSNLQKLHLIDGKIVDISFLAKLDNLQLLDLNNNQIVDVSPLQNLKNLKILILDGNQIQKFDSVQNLNNLQGLDLSENQIQDISFLRGIDNLEWLDLSKNQIKNISLDFINSFPKLEKLYLFDNQIEGISIELFGKNSNDNCLPALRDYFQSIENPEDRQELNEAKLIFVGRGYVGKSELAEALSDENYVFVQGRASTEGIRIKQWKPKNCFKNGIEVDFMVNIWDFAGQEINYGTHQFFLTKSSLYVLVWENRTEDPTNKISLEYWLNIIALLSSNSPVLVVQNKIDEKETDIPEEQLKAQFPNIQGFYKTSCKENIGIEELSKAVREQIVKLPCTSELWNKNRYAVREIIDKNSENYFTYTDYLKLCESNHINEESATFLAEQLHNIGTILHYADFPRLKETVVLKPEWATKAAYKLIDAKLNPNKGYFKEIDLDKIWADKIFAGKRLFLLDLIRRFDLVFNFVETDEYIVPDLLSIFAPKNLPNLPENNKLYFEYHYDFMPQGIMTRFICRNAGYLGDDFYIRENFFWRYGVYLQQNGAKAKVEMNEFGNAYIRMEVSGEHSEQFLYTLRSFMQEIHKKLNNPQLSEVIPCPCEKCQKQTEHKKRHYFEYERLRKLKERNKEFDICNVSYEDISINRLLTGIEPLKSKEDLILENQRKMENDLKSIKSDTIEIKTDVKMVLHTLRASFQEIQQRDIALEEKLEQQHKAIFNFLKDKSLVESQNTINQEITLFLNSSKSIQLDTMTLQYLASAEYVWQNAAQSLDYSMAITEFGKSVEGIVNLLLERFKSDNSSYAFLNIEKIDLIDKCTLLEKDKAEGKLKHQLTTNSFTDVIFLSNFNSYCNTNFIDLSALRTNLMLLLNPSHLLDKNENLYQSQTILTLIREVRNSAAHPKGIRTKQESEEYRKLVFKFFGFWCNHLK